MFDLDKELKEGEFLRVPTEERIELFELMREKYPKGNPKSQLRMIMEISDDRTPVYRDIFTSKE